MLKLVETFQRLAWFPNPQMFAYRHQNRLQGVNTKKILIATHCFFDSPHSYGNNLFPDFHDWLDFLGNMTEETDYDWYIKTHPDYVQGTMEIIESFIVKNTNIYWVIIFMFY